MEYLKLDDPSSELDEHFVLHHEEDFFKEDAVNMYFKCVYQNSQFEAIDKKILDTFALMDKTVSEINSDDRDKVYIQNNLARIANENLVVLRESLPDNVTYSYIKSCNDGVQ